MNDEAECKRCIHISCEMNPMLVVMLAWYADYDISDDNDDDCECFLKRCC